MKTLSKILSYCVAGVFLAVYVLTSIFAPRLVDAIEGIRNGDKLDRNPPNPYRKNAPLD